MACRMSVQSGWGPERETLWRTGGCCQGRVHIGVAQHTGCCPATPVRPAASRPSQGESTLGVWGAARSHRGQRQWLGAAGQSILLQSMGAAVGDANEVLNEGSMGLSASLTLSKSGWSLSASAGAMRLGFFPAGSRSMLSSTERATALPSLSSACSRSMTYGSRTRVFLAYVRHATSFL